MFWIIRIFAKASRNLRKILRGFCSCLRENVGSKTHSIDRLFISSDWPTIPQLYVNGEFIGGCDIVLQMHESGELKELFKEVK